MIEYLIISGAAANAAVAPIPVPAPPPPPSPRSGVFECVVEGKDGPQTTVKGMLGQTNDGRNEKLVPALQVVEGNYPSGVDGQHQSFTSVFKGKVDDTSGEFIQIFGRDLIVKITLRMSWNPFSRQDGDGAMIIERMDTGSNFRLVRSYLHGSCKVRFSTQAGPVFK